MFIFPVFLLILFIYSTKALLKVTNNTRGLLGKLERKIALCNAIVVFPLPAVPSTTVCPVTGKAITSACLP